MAYSQVGDLLLGDTRVDGVISTQGMVNAAADEIDAAIGSLYKTPITVSEGGDEGVNRSTVLLLKMLNNYLATGRILLTLSRTAEDKKLDALGSYYTKFALDRIAKIADGEIILQGADRQGASSPGPQNSGPMAINDGPSLMDAVYNFTNPGNPEFYTTPAYGRPMRTGPTL